MTEKQQYALKTNRHEGLFMRHLAQIHLEEDFTDVILFCEGGKLKAHRVILAAFSPYLRDIFKESSTAPAIIVFKNVYFEDLLAIIQFIYCGEAFVDRKRLLRFFETANLLQIRGLVQTKEVEAFLSDDNVKRRQEGVKFLTRSPIQSSEICTPKRKLVGKKRKQAESVKAKAHKKKIRVDEAQNLQANSSDKDSEMMLEAQKENTNPIKSIGSVQQKDTQQVLSEEIKENRVLTRTLSQLLDEHEVLRKTCLFPETVMDSESKERKSEESISHSMLEQAWKEQGVYQSNTDFSKYLQLAFCDDDYNANQ